MYLLVKSEEVVSMKSLLLWLPGKFATYEHKKLKYKQPNLLLTSLFAEVLL